MDNGNTTDHLSIYLNTIFENGLNETEVFDI